MNDAYFEYIGGSMSAEEYAALLADRELECAAVQTAENRGNGCKVCEVCSCRMVKCPAPVAPVEEGCCCRKNFRTALSLLGESAVAELVDFDQTVFITEHYTAGAALETAVAEETPADNLVEPLAGSFRRFSPCSCDLLEISAPLYAVPDTLVGLTVTQVSLCELVAVAIDLAETEGEGELTPEEVAARNFRRVRRYLTQRLGSECDRAQTCTCACGEDCCCAAGVLSALEGDAISRRVTLAAGPLLLSGVTLLGSVGTVLVLANEEEQRLYFVCVNAVEFFA